MDILAEIDERSLLSWKEVDQRRTTSFDAEMKPEIRVDTNGPKAADESPRDNVAVYSSCRSSEKTI
jgi:hypothetical protein